MKKILYKRFRKHIMTFFIVGADRARKYFVPEMDIVDSTEFLEAMAKDFEETFFL